MEIESEVTESKKLEVDTSNEFAFKARFHTLMDAIMSQKFDWIVMTNFKMLTVLRTLRMVNKH